MAGVFFPLQNWSLVTVITKKMQFTQSNVVGAECRIINLWKRSFSANRVEEGETNRRREKFGTVSTSRLQSAWTPKSSIYARRPDSASFLQLVDAEWRRVPIAMLLACFTANHGKRREAKIYSPGLMSHDKLMKTLYLKGHFQLVDKKKRQNKNCNLFVSVKVWHKTFL